MNIFTVIKDFELEYYYFEKDNHHSIFSAAEVIMDYYSQRRLSTITSIDEFIDAVFAYRAYELIHDPTIEQAFCNRSDLVEYNSILHAYFNGYSQEEVDKIIQDTIFTLPYNAKSSFKH